jgi:PAS domain S-box-containing protein
VHDAQTLSRELFERMSATSPDLLFVFDLTTRRNVYANRRLEELFGLTTDALHAIDGDHTAALIHPDDRAASDAFLGGFATAGDDEVRETEHRVRRPDGTWRWLRVRASLFRRDADGRPLQIWGITQDVTAQKQTERALRESEARYRQLANAMPQLVWTSDAAGVVDYYNARAADYAGLTRLPDGSWTWQAVVHPDDLASTVAAWAAAREADVYQHEHRIGMRDGTYRWHLSRAQAVRDAGGRIAKWFGTATDIDDSKRAEQLVVRAATRTAYLQQVTAALSAALTPAAVGRVVTEHSAAALGASLASVRLLTDDGASLREMSVSGEQLDTSRLWQSIPMDSPYPLTDAVRTGEPIWLESPEIVQEHYPALVPHMRARGYAALVSLPLRVDERVIGAMALSFAEPRAFTAEDRVFLLVLAEQCAQALERARLYEAEHLARERAERLQQRLSFLAEVTARLTASLDGPTQVDLLARLAVPRLADCCAVYVQRDSGWISRMAMAHVDPAQQQQLQMAGEDRIDPQGAHPAAQVFRSGQAVVALRLPAAPGAAAGEVPHAMVAQPLTPRAYMLFPLMVRDQILGAMSFVLTDPARSYTEEDVTFAGEVARRAALALENAHLYHEAQDAIQLRDQFLSVAAHELKTPLTALLGNAQLLQRRVAREPVLTARDQRNLAVVVEQAQRLNQLVTALLDLSRLETGQLAIQQEPLDLGALARRAVEAAAGSLEGRGLKLRCPSDAVMVYGDPLRLEQVLQNLLQNAAKYSSPPTPIAVDVVPEASSVAISVRDQGIGIPAAAIPHLFDRFYRASNAANTGTAGVGIGLYVVREIVARHGGTVGVVSTEGEGSTFTVTLPLIPAPGAGRA